MRILTSARFLFGLSIRNILKDGEAVEESSFIDGNQSAARGGLILSNDAFLQADVIIGADGANSQVRSLSGGFPYRQHDSYTPDAVDGVSQKDIRAINASQVTLLLEIAPDGNGDCPAVKRMEDGSPVEPSYPGFFLGGVAAVFKRFYRGYCHMQVLFDHDGGESIMKEHAIDGGESIMKEHAIDGAYPFELILKILGLVLVKPPTSLDALKTSILGTDLRRLAMMSVEVDTILLKRGPVVSLTGDSASSAYYRLGVGMHNLASAIVELKSLLIGIKNSRGESLVASLEEVVERKVKLSSKRLEVCAYNVM